MHIYTCIWLGRCKIKERIGDKW